MTIKISRGDILTSIANSYQTNFATLGSFRPFHISSFKMILHKPPPAFAPSNTTVHHIFHVFAIRHIEIGHYFFL